MAYGKYQELELARCSSTGLLLLNITWGMDHVKEPFKCHRPFRSKVVDMAAMTASATLQCQGVRGFELPVDTTVNEYLRGVVKANQCVIVTRSCDRQLPFVQGRPMISHDARYHFDPESMQFRDHVEPTRWDHQGFAEAQELAWQHGVAGRADHAVSKSGGRYLLQERTSQIRWRGRPIGHHPGEAQDSLRFGAL